MTNEEAINILYHIAGSYGDVSKYYSAVYLAISALKDIENCRNELCLYCGQYKQRHLGACDGCRWLPKEET